MNRVLMVFLPLFILTWACILGNSTLTNTSTTYINYTGSFNSTSSSPTTGNLSLQIAVLITLIAVAVAIILVAGIHFLGSGISGSAIPMLFMSIIGIGLWVLISSFNAFALFLSIPYGIGIVFYFMLTIAYVVGVASLSISGGGD